MIYKKLLIISNNGFSESNSNGRTLLNFFSAEDKINLAQFYLRSDKTDFNVCNNYFFASDTAVLKGVLKRKSAGSIVREITLDNDEASSSKSSKKNTKNPFTMLVRKFFWSSKTWRKDFYNWVNDFKPECILLQAGDAPFLYNIAVEIAKKYNVPMVIYNSEDYYFKNYNYFKNSKITGALYPLFHLVLKKAVKKAIDYASVSIYISDDLKDTYDKEFNKKSVAIYTAATVKPNLTDTKKPIFSYLGNLGVDRHIGLIKIAEALNKINPDYKLDVYGKLPNYTVKKCFEDCDFLSYRGLIGYDEVKEIISKSMLVFHTESMDPFYCKDIKHGFSTKIADSLASGTCFVIFAPEMLSCTKYVKENKCGCVITDESEIEQKLKEIIADEELRNKYISNALRVVEKNHNLKKNKDKFADIINNL